LKSAAVLEGVRRAPIEQPERERHLCLGGFPGLGAKPLREEVGLLRDEAAIE